MTLKYTLLLWQISVHSVFSRYLDSLFFSILGWMADVRKGGKHVKIGENSVLIFQNVVRLPTHLLGPEIRNRPRPLPPPPPPRKKKKKKPTREILDEMVFARPFFAIFAFYKALRKLPPANKEKRDMKTREI